jgi:putative transposase
VDPGQRTLGTVYTPRGYMCDACGSDDPDKGTGKLKALLKRASAAKANRAKRKHRLEKARRRIKRARRVDDPAAKAQLKELSARLQRAQQAVERRTARVRGWVTQMHRSYARWLLSEFDTVIYPYFGTQGMVRKSGPLHPAVKKILMRQRHYKLRRYIEDRARTLGKEVVFVTEYYTTQECGVCGHRNKDVGPAKVFQCTNDECRITMPRDGNGARNIMLQMID